MEGEELKMMSGKFHPKLRQLPGLQLLIRDGGGGGAAWRTGCTRRAPWARAAVKTCDLELVGKKFD